MVATIPIASAAGTESAVSTGNPYLMAAAVAATLGADYLGGFGGKHKDQQQRDQYRSMLKDAGIYDQDYNLTLTDGSKVNMGLDGSIKNYNVDFSKPGIDKVVSYVNPLAHLIANGNTKMANDLAGELTNAIYNTKDPAAEARALYQKFGITGDQAVQAINKLSVDDKTKQVFAGTLNQLGLPNSGGGNVGDLSAQSDEIGRLRAATQGFISRVQQDAAAQQAANKQAVKNQAAQQAGAYRSNLLQNMMQDTTQPINFPTATTKSTASSFLSKLPQNLATDPTIPPVQRPTFNPKFADQSAVQQNFNSTLAKILGK